MTPHNPNWLERWCIAHLTRAIARVIDVVPQRLDYEGFVAISQQVKQGRSPAAQQQVIAAVFAQVIPPWISTIVRTLFRPTRWVCETNAWFATRLTGWLVGSSDRYWVEVLSPNQTPQRQLSGVRIQKCYYLAQAECAALCINLCKHPTEEFFRNQLGLPLTMTPNFSDYSCEMVFGTPLTPIPPPAIPRCFEQPHLDPCPHVLGSTPGAIAKEG
ncbi:DUF4033 domain-containing protein [Synechococcus sp. PCC 6717]|uniref:Beta-carotene isomerase D27-like C-terminal domain-containing protein n=1 Tax=Parathermosynechococcus lividus PCC 6715 TaxID=1917166 RepID=A0A2D2Q274_PARLV|nr:DUF4033 domain-containing protein [Thermostichus lividus]ATS18367.1 hypothetical protein BRW62_05915 [Thermostichus lividus PCC 6715]MCI3279383.1 DUF4033 domain-containing protein [Synechococcus sp. PCC 6717]